MTDKIEGTYAWFREYGYGPLKALKRTISWTLEGLIPFPRHLQEENILQSISYLKRNLEQISSEDYDPKQQRKDHLKTHTPESMIVHSYGHLNCKKEHFSKKVKKEFDELEVRVLELEQKGKLELLTIVNKSKKGMSKLRAYIGLGEDNERKYQSIVNSWSQVLYWTCKEESSLNLGENLIPPLDSKVQKAWEMSLAREGFTQNEMEEILKKFGEAEIKEGNKLWLGWGGYIERKNGTYELHKSTNILP